MTQESLAEQIVWLVIIILGIIILSALALQLRDVSVAHNVTVLAS